MGGRGGAFKQREWRLPALLGVWGGRVCSGGVVMPGRPDDYEVLLTIGAGSYGKCRKVRRKADGKVRRRRWGHRGTAPSVALPPPPVPSLSASAGNWRLPEISEGLCKLPSPRRALTRSIRRVCFGFFSPRRSWCGRSSTTAR